MDRPYTIATLGSHSALQILKGAHDEGFRTLAISNRDTERLYRSFAFVDEVIALNDYSEFMSKIDELERRKVIIVPHGSFVAYLSLEEHKKMTIPYFGNKAVLDWEASRELQRQWLSRAGLKLPRQFRSGRRDRPAGHRQALRGGGRQGLHVHSRYPGLRGARRRTCKEAYTIQEYIIGVPLYIHYFYSPLHAASSRSCRWTGATRRTSIRSGRIPARRAGGHGRRAPPTWWSGISRCRCASRCWPRRYRMGEDVVRVSKEICGPKGLFGAFCIETIITPDIQFYVMEISARIVAGTNLFIDGSPYSYLNYTEPMSTGRRIAREIKNALLTNNLHLVLDDSSVV